MKYKLTEQYFETQIFQQTVQLYFDTVLNGILNYKPVIQAKGLFIIDNEVKADLHDMPYHIHILNGLIPALFVYEQFSKQRGLIENEEIEKYLKTFILGFTFHDADKLTGKSWDTALDDVANLDKTFNLSNFFKDFHKYKADVFFVSLSTEDRTEAMKNRYKISLDYKHLNEILAPLCNFADGLASIQELDSVESFYSEAQKTLNKITQVYELPISYIKLHENPYTLLSQNLLNVAGRVLTQNGRKILYTMRNGILFFGEDLQENEKQKIFEEFEGAQKDDINIETLVKINAQQCDLSSIKSIGISQEILNQIIRKKTNAFLSLSPNSQNSIPKLCDLVSFSERIFDEYINVTLIENENNSSKNKINLFFTDNEDEENDTFKTLFCLHKIQWLNTKINKNWELDFDKWLTSDYELPDVIIFEDEKLNTIKDIVDLFDTFSTNASGKLVKTTKSNLLKVYLCYFKTLHILSNEDDIDEYSEKQYKEVEKFYTKQNSNNNQNVFYELYKYFTYKGNTDFSYITEFIPKIPEKKKMCVFTGKLGSVEYKEVNAHSLKATGFNNRTWSSLKNTNNPVNYISPLFDEENKLRNSAFEFKKIGATEKLHTIFYDFFETSLEIEKDIFKTVSLARNVELFNEVSIELYKNSKFNYGSNVHFVKDKGDMKSLFYFVRKQLLLIKKIGFRVLITGINSTYTSHKEVFVYENAPRFIKDLHWNNIRLAKIDEVLSEIELLRLLGESKKGFNSGLVLNYAESPKYLFRAFYEFSNKSKEDKIIKARKTIIEFITKYPHKFKNMTTIEKIVEIALKIQSSAKSGSEETWLIRTALDYIRKNRKEKRSKEDTIQQIGGNIHKTLRQERINSNIIQEFARLVYEELYEKEWKGTLPTINRQKDWIYQFGFVYKMKVDELINDRVDDKIIKKLEDNKLEVTIENITTQLSEKQKYFAETIIARILNKVNNK